MQREWKIKDATMVFGGANRTQLIGCSIFRDSTGNVDFRSPGTVHTTIPKPSGGDVKPTFDFDMIDHPLTGTVKREWYIRVVAMDAGPKKNLIYGEWSNDAFKSGDEEPDTFTAQAGV